MMCLDSYCGCHYFVQSGLCMSTVRAVPAFLPSSWNHLRWLSDTIHDVSRLHSCLWFSKTGYQETVNVKEVSTIFPDDVALLAQTEVDLQHEPEYFVAESQTARMKINISKCKTRYVETGADPGPVGVFILHNWVGREYSGEARISGQSRMNFSACCHDSPWSEMKNE